MAITVKPKNSSCGEMTSQDVRMGRRGSGGWDRGTTITIECDQEASSMDRQALVDCLLRNKADGIHYGHGRDYDGKSSEGQVYGC